VNPEEMRAKALECDEMVWKAHDPAVARRYAAWPEWRQLADQIEGKANQDATGACEIEPGPPGPSLLGVLPLWTQTPLSGHKNRNAPPTTAIASRQRTTIVIPEIYHDSPFAKKSPAGEAGRGTKRVETRPMYNDTPSIPSPPFAQAFQAFQLF
jgi:hypothetical protein